MELTRRNFVAGASVAAAALAAAAPAVAEEAPAAAPNAVRPIDVDKLMPADLGQEWHEFKASCGPLYPGYAHYEEYLHFIYDRLTEYGCVDFLEHHWDFESYICEDWPVHEGTHRLSIDGVEYPVATHMQLSGFTNGNDVTAPLMYYSLADGEPEEGAFEGRIVCMEPNDWPEKPYTESFMGTYVITDTNYRSDPKPPAAIGEIADPTLNCSWANRWDFGQWGTMNKYAYKGKAAGLIVCSKLPYGAAKGCLDRQSVRSVGPSLVVDREVSPVVLEACAAGKDATVGLDARWEVVDNWNFLCFLPGKNYGTEADEYISINSHSDAMGLTQDNGALGCLAICHYFSQIPQEERNKTLVFCIDTRHFIEGAESGNFEHDPYQVYPEVAKKMTATVGVEHLGELEAAWDLENNDMVPTGNPEYSFCKSDDNDWCAHTLIQAAKDSGLERADVKIDGRPGNHGMYKGLVRAVQASTHNLGVCVIGEAGNWPGSGTQEYGGKFLSQIDFFSKKKFYDEMYMWTQVVSNMMDVDSRVYDVCWADLNGAIRALATSNSNANQGSFDMAAGTGADNDQAFLVSEKTMNGMLLLVSDIFKTCEAGEYAQAAERMETEFKQVVADLAPEIDLNAEVELTRGMWGNITPVAGQEWETVVACANAVIARLTR